MNGLIHQLLAGLVSGSIYASLALALVMIYQSTHHINFAQGEMAMFSTYTAWSLIQAGLPYWIAFVATVLLSFCVGVLIERFVVRPIGRDSVLATVVVFIGLLAVVNSAAGWIWDYTLRQFPSPFSGLRDLGFRYMTPHEIGLVCLTLANLLIVYAFFRFTKLGLAMRAAAQNPVSAQLLGIRVKEMLALGWGLAAAIGAVAGMLVAPIVYLEPNMMSGVLIYAFAGALVGGIDNAWGAVLGGVLVGLLENVLGAYVIGTQFKLGAALLLIVLALIFWPHGLFGRGRVARV